MRKSDTALKFILLTASVVLLASSTWAVKSWQQLTAATAVTGVAFFDCNSNGIRDNNEAPFESLNVRLAGTTTAGNTIAFIVATDNMGNYSFVGVEAGTYAVSFMLPTRSTALSFTTKNAAANGSDVNSNGTTDSLSINGTTDMQGVDAGIIDRTAPVVTFTNPFLTPYANGDTVTVQCDNLPTMNASWASAKDNTGKAVSVEFIDLAISTNECARTGYITLLDCIFRATDACGNVGEKAVFVKIKDSKAPVLSGVPSDITINTLNGERIPANSGVSATDNCAANPVPITFLEMEAANTCGKTITRTWSASDDCGNIARRFQVITVISNATCGGGTGGGSTDTLRLNLTHGVTIDTCLKLSAGSMLSNIQHCSAGQPSATVTLTASNCLRITPSVNFVGLDTFCARVCDVNGQNCQDMKLLFRVSAARLGTTCDILSDRGSINLNPRTCGENACYCIVGTTDIQTLNRDYTITDNGQIYNGGLSGCQFDTIFSYNYFTVPNMGATGAYRLDYWRVNGTTRQIASFQTIQQLTDSMNIWDPMGNWRIDDSRFLIYGGDMRSQYGQMKITQLSNLAFGVLDLNTGLISNGVKLCFPRGLHNVIFQNNVTGCADTLRANVFCADDRRAPIAADDRVSTNKNTPVRIAATLNDTLNGVFESLNILGRPLHGSITQGAETFLYTPTTDYCGRDTVDYRVCNAFGLCDTGRIFVAVTCSNDTMGNARRRPVAVDDIASTRLNTSTTFTVLANDTLNGALTRPLSISRFPMHGSVNITNNEITYTPMSGFCGARDTFDYEICNENGCDTGRVVVSVNCAGDTTGSGTRRPIAVDDNASTQLNNSVTIAVLANDTINGTLTRGISIVRFQAHGTVNIMNNQFMYTPADGFCNARDSFDYEICNANGCDTGRVVVTVMCQSDTIGNGSRRPVAFDDAVMTRLNTPVTISVLANDSLNGTLRGSINIVRFQMHGTVNVINNRILYTPDLGFCGDRDTFDYAICNANGCDTGRVFVTVTCENDGSGRPVAVDDRATTRLDSRVVIPVLDNDKLNGFLTSSITVVKTPRRGTSLVSNNQITYMPNAMFCGGNDTLDYIICNAIGCDTASVIITITCNNDTTSGNAQKPVANNDRVLARINTSLTISPLANDTLNGVLTRPLSIIGAALHGQTLLMSNQILYIPHTDYCGGNDTLNYEICNTNGCDTAQIIVEISCDNGRPKPVAVDDVARTRLNTSVTVSVLTNDVLNGNLSIPLSIVRSQTHGVASVVNNQIIYTPSSGYCNGLDTIDYQICNGNGCDTGRLIITVSCDTSTNGGGGSGRAVVAVNDNVSTAKNTSLTFRPTINDTIRTKLLALSITRLPSKGEIAFRGLDTLLYTPNRDFCGKDTLVYTICDTSFVCSDAMIFINVTCMDTTINGGGNRKPNAFNDFTTTQKGRAVTIAVLTNDSTYGTLTRPVTVTRAPKNGVTAVQNNQIVYTPNAMYCGGQDTLAYEICNTNGCDTATVFVAVTCDTTVNNGGSRRPVVAVNDNVTTLKNTSLTFKPTDNDTIQTKLLSLMIINPPRNGAIGFRGLDTLLYTPSFGFCGRDTFEYSICDTSFNCNNAFVFINVTCDTVSTRLSPIAVPDYATTRKNTPIRINILTNDTLNGVLDSIRIISFPRRGTATLGNDNVVTYSTDTCGFTDTLVYRICNRNGCDTALVAIKVSCDTIVTPRILPIAVNDTARTKSGQPVTISVLQNDTLNGILAGRVGITQRPRFGIALVNGNNELVYTPQSGFCGGRDTVNYEICNASGCDTAIVSINVVCDSLMATFSPIAVFDTATTRKNTAIRIPILANDTLNGTLDSIKIIRSPLLGMASLGSDNVLTYTPDSCGFTDSLVYRICNKNGCDTAIVRIKVTCDTVITNLLAPVAVFDTVRTPKGQVVTIRVTLNDTLRGADTFRITRSPLHGIAMFDIDHHIAYKSDLLYCGNDTLIYEICNNRGCDTALVIIKVTCDTLPPVIRPDAVDDFVKTIINRRVDFVILGNDILRGARFAEMVSPPSHGTIIIMPDSMAMYKPDKEFCGKDSFRYRICNTAGCDTAMVRIDVSCGDTLNVFSGFSPNNDGKNDLLVIRGIENHPDNEVVIMNRWGNQVFSKKGYRNESGWDGTWGDKHVPNGTYFYCIRLNDPKNQQFTGYIQLMR
jgi:gliding motility-associated-like protein